jgi:hypothetical protein
MEGVSSRLKYGQRFDREKLDRFKTKAIVDSIEIIQTMDTKNTGKYTERFDKGNKFICVIVLLKTF